jgi:transaldolase
MYVEELIGSDTVNTVPLATLEAFRDHGRVDATLVKDLARAHEDMDRLAALGIDLGAISAELEADGVRKFAESHQRLIELLDGKHSAGGEEQAAI